MRFIVYVFVALTILGAPAFATSTLSVGGCESLTSPNDPVLTVDAADEILGQYRPMTEPKILLGKVVNFLVTHPQRNLDEAAANMEMLLTRVRKYVGRVGGSEWTFTRFGGIDGSIGFTGPAGQPLVISPNGDIYTGPKFSIMASVYRNEKAYVWQGDYSRLIKIGHIQLGLPL